MRYSQLKLSFNHIGVNPLYDYTFRTAGQEGITDYTSTDIRIDMRFAFNEKIIESFNRRVSLGTDYPVLNLQYTRGLKGVYNGDFDFNKIEASIEDSFYAKNLGETRFTIQGGYVDRALPYGLLFTGEGTFDNRISLLIDNYFQTRLLV